MSADAYFLPAVIALGVVSTVQDFRVRRISNIWIIISLIYALIGHIVLFAVGNHQENVWAAHYLVNTLISAAVAVYFWKQHWWGGGDAKLFVSYSLLIPFAHYSIIYFDYYFVSFLLLLATFIPAAIWTFAHAQFNLLKAGKSIADNFHPSKARLLEFFYLSAGFTAIFFLSNLLAVVLNQYFYWIKDFSIVIWFLGIGFYKVVFRLFQKRLWLVFVSWVLGICIAVFVSFFYHINMWNILIRSFALWVLVFIARQYMLRTIGHYVEWSKNNNMAFAGWMFLGVLAIWFSKIFFTRF